jgi:hypothetical protein
MQHALYISPGEIIAYRKQPAAVPLGHLVRKTVSQVEPCRMHSIAPLLISPRYAPRFGRVEHNHRKPKPFDQARNLPGNIPPRGGHPLTRNRPPEPGKAGPGIQSITHNHSIHRAGPSST